MAQIEVRADFTLDELLAQIGGGEVRDGYYTACEWAAHFGISERRIMHVLRAAKLAGRLATARDRRESLDGSLRPVPVYRILGAGK